jgi:hypothetical protein
MTRQPFRYIFTTRNLIRVAFTALSLSSIGAAHSAPTGYHPPQQNYQQNNWMARGEG